MSVGSEIPILISLRSRVDLRGTEHTRLHFSVFVVRVKVPDNYYKKVEVLLSQRDLLKLYRNEVISLSL